MQLELRTVHRDEEHWVRSIAECCLAIAHTHFNVQNERSILFLLHAGPVYG